MKFISQAHHHVAFILHCGRVGHPEGVYLPLETVDDWGVLTDHFVAKDGQFVFVGDIFLHILKQFLTDWESASVYYLNPNFFNHV